MFNCISLKPRVNHCTTLLALLCVSSVASLAPAVETIWNGGAGDNWSDGGNWSAGLPGIDDDVKFTDSDSATDTITVTNIVDSDRTINSLWYSNVDLFGAGLNVHHTQIGPGTTLTVGGSKFGFIPSPANADGPYAIWVGMGVATDAGSAGITHAIISGAGTLTVTKPIDIVVRNTTISGGNAALDTRDAILDMSGLANFNGRFEKLLVGTSINSTSNAVDTAAAGTIRLAQNTVLTSHRNSTGNFPTSVGGGDVITLGWGHPSVTSSSSQGRMEIGQNATLNVTSFSIGKDRSTGSTAMVPGGVGDPFEQSSTVRFQSGLVNPTLTLRGHTGGDSRLNYFALGDSSAGTSASTGSTLRNSTGYVDLTDSNGGSNGAIDAMIDMMYVGRSMNSTAPNPVAWGRFKAQAGTLDVNTLRIGWQQANANTGSQARQHAGVGIVDLSGTITANVRRNTNLGRDAGTGTRTGAGTLNLSGNATFNSYGHISENNASGNGSSTLTLANAAVLNMRPGSDELSGDIEVDTITLGAGATISNARNITSNSTVIGFYTTDVSGGGPTGEFGTALSGSGSITGLTGALTVNYSNATPGSFDGSISGSGRFVKGGTGTYALGGNNTFTGSTTISGGTLQLTSATALGSSSAINVGAADATLDVTPLGAYSVRAGQTVTGIGTVNGSVSLASNRLISAGAGTLDIGTLTVNGDVSLSGGIVVVDVSSAGTNDAINATNVNVNSASAVYINPTGADVAVGTQNILGYSGSLTLSGALNVIGPLAAGESRRTATIGNTGPSGGNVTVTFGGSAPLANTWNGNGTTNRWEANGADSNWNSGGGANTDKYFNLDTANFGIDGGANNSVNIAENVYAGAVNINSPYTFTGTGKFTTPSLSINAGGSLTISNSQVNEVTGNINIDGAIISNQSVNYTNPISITGAGTGSYLKIGSNRETITGDNIGFLGTVGVTNGTLRVGSNTSTTVSTALGDALSGTSISGNGTLDLNGYDVGNEPISVSGAGSGGVGAITQMTEDVTASNRTDIAYLGTTITPEMFGVSVATGKVSNLTLTGATTLGSQGSSAWAVTASAANNSNFTGNGHNLTKVGTGYVRLISQGDTELGDIDIQSGTLSFEFGNINNASALPTTMGNSGGTMTVRTGATLASVNAQATAGQTSVISADKNLVFENGSTWLFQSSGSAPTQTGSSYNPAMTSSGTISLTGDVTFNMQAFSNSQNIQIGSNISGSGRLIKDGVGALMLSGDNSAWTGDLQVRNGNVKITSPLAINDNVDIDLPVIGGSIVSGNANLMFEPGAGQTISYGGVIAGSGAVRVGGLGDPTGVVILNGDSTFEGSTAVVSGTLLINGIHSGSGATIATAGATLGGNGSMISISIQTGGILNPGVGIGTITGTGTGTIAGTMKVEYSGSSIDKLVIADALDITTGIVDFDQLGSSLTGGAHVFASYGSLVGSMFASVLDLPAGFNIDYNYLGGNQIALVGAPIGLAGDFDGDGDVDGADFVAWQTNFPTASGADKADGDADGDFDVDGADFSAWQTGFPSPGSGTAIVPEPMSISLAAIAVVGLLVFNQRKWS